MASNPSHGAAGAAADSPDKSRNDGVNAPTIAAFSPSQPRSSSTSSASATQQRSTIVVHRKSPLLIATPPSVTRALAFSHPFILPLNHLLGLLTWTSGDACESFLLLAGFWGVTLYADVAIRYVGPLIVVIVLIFCMYSRRFSPLSSTSWTGEKPAEAKDESTSGNAPRHQKSLDEIVETLHTFTTRSNMLLEPCLLLTDFLSTQQTATAATTRPALTHLFIRILFVTPIWISLTFPPLHVLTTRRVVMAIGTVALSWHSRPARVTRALLWRSRLVRRLTSFATGLDFNGTTASSSKSLEHQPTLTPQNQKTQNDIASSLALTHRTPDAAVRFTFVVFENQRRWLGLGWTSSLLAYERAAWTDEHLNACEPTDKFQLPKVSSGIGVWRWVPGSEWKLDTGAGTSGSTSGKASGSSSSKVKSGSGSSSSDGWIYYDNKWSDGRRGQDGWGRYTRRRKWYRDAELVESSASGDVDEDGLGGSVATLRPADDEANIGDSHPATSSASSNTYLNVDTIKGTSDVGQASAGREAGDSAAGKPSSAASTPRRSFFRRSQQPQQQPQSPQQQQAQQQELPKKRRGSNASSARSTRSNSDFSGATTLRNDEEDTPHMVPPQHERSGDWEVGDDVKMGLG